MGELFDRAHTASGVFVVLNENENFWGKYSENSDLTRLVGRHSFGG